MKKTLTLGAMALALASAIAAGAYFLLVERGGLPDDPLLLAPEETAILARVDLSAVRRSPLFEKLVEERGLDAGIGALAEECGYDLFGAIDELFVFIRPEEDHASSIALVGAGRLDVDAAVGCMRARLSENEVELEETTLEGFRALTSPKIAARAAFVGSRGVVLGEEPMVVDILKRVRGEIPKLDAGSHLAELYGRVSPRRDVAIAAELPENWHRAARGVLEPEHAYRLMPSLMTLHEAGLGISVRDGLSLGAVLIFEDDEAAKKASEVVERTVDNLKKNVFLSLTAAAPAIASIDVESEGEEIRLGFSVTEPQLLDLLRVAEKLGEDAR